MGSLVASVLAILVRLVTALALTAPGAATGAPSGAGSSAGGSATRAPTGRPSAGAVTADLPLSLQISIVGNHFVNGDGQTVRLLGVNTPGTEYACQQGWGFSDQASDAVEAAAIAGWHATAVRVPLNEDCWLGLNGSPAFGTVTGYRQYVVNWVNTLNAAGLYAVVDLHWSAPGTQPADGQRPMPDDHSPAFWTSVATTFKADPAVVFDLFNEPYSPKRNGNSTLDLTWDCWRDGGCPLPVANQNATINDSQTYTAVGMQTLVNTVRATGATQPIMVAGVSYANDLTGWLSHEPTDPAGQLAASWHEYAGNDCASSCWTSTVTGVAAQAPVVAGEFDAGYDCVGAPASAASWDAGFLTWADTTGLSYLAWGWWVLDGNPQPACATLQDPGDTYTLTSDRAGTPFGPDGTALHAHLATLAAAPPPSSPSMPPNHPGPPPAHCGPPPHGACTE